MLQNVFSFSKLEFLISYFKLDATETKQLLEIFAIMVLTFLSIYFDR